jgi:hypothetical protein
MENVRLNIAYDLLLKNTKLSFNPRTSERLNSTSVLSVNQIYFVICNSCYWCASYFGTNSLKSSSHILDCRACNSRNIEFIPVETDESLRIQYNHSRGMEIEFYKNNNIVTR